MKHIKNNNLEMCEAVANILKFIKSTSLHKAFFFIFLAQMPTLFYCLKDASIQVKEWWIYVDNSSLNNLELKKY